MQHSSAWGGHRGWFWDTSGGTFRVSSGLSDGVCKHGWHSLRNEPFMNQSKQNAKDILQKLNVSKNGYKYMQGLRKFVRLVPKIFLRGVQMLQKRVSVRLWFFRVFGSPWGRCWDVWKLNHGGGGHTKVLFWWVTLNSRTSLRSHGVRAAFWNAI